MTGITIAKKLNSHYEHAIQYIFFGGAIRVHARATRAVMVVYQINTLSTKKNKNKSMRERIVRTLKFSCMHHVGGTARKAGDQYMVMTMIVW